MKYFFQAATKKLLKRKNCTIRVRNERGKYGAGKIYAVKSYTGKDWDIQIKITNVFTTTIDDLSKFGIPKRSIRAVQKKEKIPRDETVELIRFKVVR